MRIKSFLFSTLALTAGLLTIYSCTAELEQYPQRGPVTEEADFLVITENPVTKTVFDGEHTLWAENDKISAINIEDGGDEYYASSMTYRGDNRFGGRVTYAGDVNNWYLIYPYRADNVTPKETHIHIPEVQVQNGNDDMSHIAGEGFPLIGKELGVSRNNQLQVTMRNVLARLDFKVTNTAGSAMVFKQVVFTAPDNVCGDFVGDITNDTPSWTAQPGAFKNLTLNIENGTPVANGELAQFHAGIAPLRIPANGSIKAKVVAVSPSAPENEIVFYHIFNITNGTTLRSGTSYGFNMSFDTAHSVDPTPDEPIIENQVISFDQENVTWQLGAGYSTGVPYDVQTLNGAHTSVDYVSSNTNVATIDGAKIYIVGPGNTTITANAREENGYSGATASYELTVLAASTPSGTVYVKASSLTVGGTYLIVDHQDQRLFKGSTDGSYVSVSPVNGVITDSNNSLSNYEFTITQSNDAYCIIFNDNRYLVCDYSNNSSAGLRYESSKPAAQYLYSLTINNNGAFEFSTSQMNSTSTHEVLYYKSSSDLFKIGGSGSGIGVHLYLKDSSSTPGKQPQTLSFSQSEVTETMATASGTLAVQPVSGAQTDVNYTSSNTNVATVSGTTLYIQGFGRTTITANAVESNVYSSASVSYELIIAQGGSTPTGPRTYTYVAPGSLEPGTYVIAGSETNELSVALFPSVGTGSWNSQTTGQVNNGQYVPHKVVGSNNSVSSFTTEDSEIFNSEVVLAKSGNNWTIQVKSTGQYLVVPTQEYRISFVGSSSATAFEISNGTNGATVRSGSYYFYHSGSAGGFTFRTNSTSNIRFYQSSSSGTTPGKQDQNLTFSSATVNWTIGQGYTQGGNYAAQTPNNYYGTLSYSSGDRSVATVSGNRIYIVAPGTAKITVTASGNDDYNPGTASYTLNILPESGVMVYNLENDRLKGYLDKVEANPYDPEDYSYTHMTSEFYGGWGEMNQNNRYDIPKPVPVSWSNPTSSNGTKVVYIYNDSAMTDLELSVTGIASNATSADVYNLIPGRMYYYKVTNSGSNWTSTGQFMTTGRRRMMKVGNGYGNNYANNCRDFGGQVTTSGKKIKYGKIYRGSNMDSTSSDAKTLLTGYMNIGLDLDLRTSGEHRNPLGVTCPDPGYNGWGTDSNGLRNVKNMQTTLNAVFDAVAAGEGVYIHCAIGADRTGYVCMLLEAILGVSQGNCDVDYEITSLSCVGTKTRTGTGNYYYLSSGNEKRGVDYVNTFNGNTFQEKAIDCLVSYYGISMQTITAFQNAMLE